MGYHSPLVIRICYCYRLNSLRMQSTSAYGYLKTVLELYPNALDCAVSPPEK